MRRRGSRWCISTSNTSFTGDLSSCTCKPLTLHICQSWWRRLLSSSLNMNLVRNCESTCSMSKTSWIMVGSRSTQPLRPRILTMASSGNKSWTRWRGNDPRPMRSHAGYIASFDSSKGLNSNSWFKVNKMKMKLLCLI